MERLDAICKEQGFAEDGQILDYVDKIILEKNKMKKYVLIVAL